MAATKVTKKKAQKTTKPLQPAAGRLTWILAITFAALSVVFVVQAFCYYA